LRSSWTAPSELGFTRSRIWRIELFSAFFELISGGVCCARHKELTRTMTAHARIWSTDEVSHENRIERWRKEVSEPLLRVEWAVPDGHDCNARLLPVICASDIEIALLESGPFDITNTPAHASEKQHRCSLNIMTGGHRAVIAREDGEFIVSKTMGIMIDEGKFYRYRSDNELTRALILMLPKARIMERAPALECVIGAPFDLSCEPFRLLQSYLGLSAAGVNLNIPALARANADYVIDLVVMMLDGRADNIEAAQRRTLPETRYRVILSEIERGIGDPKLSGKAVAARVGITERYLQQLMEVHGETFSHFVLRQRLDKAAAMLVSKRGLRIAEVAFLCGFADLSYFNRSFRKRFGETPRGYRK
jgi:AraC-like DNA-binding protein